MQFQLISRHDAVLCLRQMNLIILSVVVAVSSNVYITIYSKVLGVHAYMGWGGI